MEDAFSISCKSFQLATKLFLYFSNDQTSDFISMKVLWCDRCPFYILCVVYVFRIWRQNRGYRQLVDEDFFFSTAEVDSGSWSFYEVVDILLYFIAVLSKKGCNLKQADRVVKWFCVGIERLGKRSFNATGLVFWVHDGRNLVLRVERWRWRYGYLHVIQFWKEKNEYEIKKNINIKITYTCIDILFFNWYISAKVSI